jgi:hypothetical protein
MADGIPRLDLMTKATVSGWKRIDIAARVSKNKWRCKKADSSSSAPHVRGSTPRNDNEAYLLAKDGL